LANARHSYENVALQKSGLVFRTTLAIRCAGCVLVVEIVPPPQVINGSTRRAAPAPVSPPVINAVVRSRSWAGRAHHPVKICRCEGRIAQVALVAAAPIRWAFAFDGLDEVFVVCLCLACINSLIIKTRFPCVCPEPVLVKLTFWIKSAQKRPFPYRHRLDEDSAVNSTCHSARSRVCQFQKQTKQPQEILHAQNGETRRQRDRETTRQRDRETERNREGQ
jgi:hypothetical protein